MLTGFMGVMIPVFVLLVALVLNVNALVDAKLRLQMATDRAAYAGAAKQAYVMNKIGEDNWQIHQLFLKLEKDLKAGTKKSDQEAVGHVRATMVSIQQLEEDMEHRNVTAHEKATNISKQILVNNDGVATLQVKTPSGPMLTLSDTEEVGQWQTLSYAYTTGSDPFDPENHSSGERSVLSYVVKTPSPTVVWSIAATAPLPQGILFGVLKKYLSNPLPQLQARATAQPYHGSIKRYKDLAVVDLAAVPAAAIAVGADYQVSYAPR